MRSSVDLGDGSVRVICGPTAAGKSAIAIELAERFAAGIISADSRQVYCGFDVGTAKASATERERVPHFGIDILNPEERFSAASWAHRAEGWIANCRVAGRVPLIVGGTGFYLRALFDSLFIEPTLDAQRRARLAEFLDTLSMADLRRWCATLDRGRAGLGRAQLLRSLEIAMLTGVRLSDWHRSAPRSPRLRPRYLLVDPGGALGGRIAARVDAMFCAGWVDEARSLAVSVPANAPAWNATGYAAVRLVADGVLGAADARTRVVIATRQYAKRQRTWFRHQLPTGRVTRIDPEQTGWERLAERWWADTQED
jgi:tRNA dimethylallyltransferase